METIITGVICLIVGYFVRKWHAPILVNAKLWKVVEEYERMSDLHIKQEKRLLETNQHLRNQLREMTNNVQAFLDAAKIKDNDKK